MKEVTLILSLSPEGEETVHVSNVPPGPYNLLGAHSTQQAEVPQEIWDLLVSGDELDSVAQAAFELGRKLERGEYRSVLQ